MKNIKFILPVLSIFCGYLVSVTACSNPKEQKTSENISPTPVQESQERIPAACCDKQVLLKESDMAVVARYVRALWNSEPLSSSDPLPARFNTPAQAVYLAARSNGLRIFETWTTDGTTQEALTNAIQLARSGIPPDRFSSVNVLEIVLSHSYEPFFLNEPASKKALLSNIHRGVKGLELSYGSITARYAPTYILASNRDNKRLIELFCQQNNITEADFVRTGKVYQFEGEQVLVRLKPKLRATLMERGNVYVRPEEVTRKNILNTALRAGQWLVNNVHKDGRMTYKYWPSSGKESDSNNMIRQWMGTVGLIRFGKMQQDDSILALAEKNIGYNLTNFFYEEDGYGLINEQGSVKLGAVALACLALFEHPKREQWLPYEISMQRTIDSLWNTDGSFTTFFKPKGVNRNQNFYPGEALVYWAHLYEKYPNPDLLDRFLRSFEYYKAWHLDPSNRNPAFIPWHTQAYYIIWKIHKWPALAEFIFEMNDWLLPVQQWPKNPEYRDILGRFYDPDRPFGPPHASSTGVYLEGLIDAFALARSLGDEERMKNYRIAINRGLRSVMQLQFVDDIDMFYISPSNRRYVEGGIRTTEYNNEIRCDNIQHNLMAMIKILDTFVESDFGIF